MGKVLLGVAHTTWKPSAYPVNMPTELQISTIWISLPLVAYATITSN